MVAGEPPVRVVVDTNVVAYYLLGTTGFEAEASAFWRRVREPMAPASWQPEIANVLWMAARHGALSAAEARSRLRLAGRLGIRAVPVTSLWEGALARALATGVAAYDTLFVELAVRRRLPLATFDRQLHRAFANVAARPQDL